MCVVMLAVVMASVLAAVLVSQKSLANTQTVLDRVNNDFQDANKVMAEFQQLQQQRQTMTNKAKSTTLLLERVPRSYLLAMVTTNLPDGASLLDINLYPKRVFASVKTAKDLKTAPKPKGPIDPKPAVKAEPVMLEMEVTGLADTDVAVARFIANMAKNPLAQSVDLIYSQERSMEIRDERGLVKQDKILMREFQVRLALRGDMDVIELLNPNALSAQASTPPQVALKETK